MVKWTKKDVIKLHQKGLSIKNVNLFSETEVSDDLYELLKLMIKRKQAMFIPGNIPSLKNSKQIVQAPTKKSTCCNAGLMKNNDILICTSCLKPTRRKTNPFLVPSKTVEAYVKRTIEEWVDSKTIFFKVFGDKRPINCAIFFVRDSRRRYDYHNAQQIIGDLMIKYGMLQDDDKENLKFLPIGSVVDESSCGVIMFNLEKFDKYVLVTLKRTLYGRNETKPKIPESGLPEASSNEGD